MSSASARHQPLKSLATTPPLASRRPRDGSPSCYLSPSQVALTPGLLDRAVGKKSTPTNRATYLLQERLGVLSTAPMKPRSPYLKWCLQRSSCMRLASHLLISEEFLELFSYHST